MFRVHADTVSRARQLLAAVNHSALSCQRQSLYEAEGRPRPSSTLRGRNDIPFMHSRMLGGLFWRHPKESLFSTKAEEMAPFSTEMIEFRPPDHID